MSTFQVHVDRKPTKFVADTLQEAKRLASSLLDPSRTVTIEANYVVGNIAVAPCRTWVYVHAGRFWEEVIN